jgi:hypothetical protein
MMKNMRSIKGSKEKDVLTESFMPFLFNYATYMVQATLTRWYARVSVEERKVLIFIRAD